MDQPAVSRDDLLHLLALRRRVRSLAIHHVSSLGLFHLDAPLLQPRSDKMVVSGFTNLLPEKLPNGQRVVPSKIGLSSTASCVRSIFGFGSLVGRYEIDCSELLHRITMRFNDEELNSEGLDHLNIYTVGLILPVLRLVGAAPSSRMVASCIEVARSAVEQEGVRLDGFPPNGYLTYWALRGLEDWSETFRLDLRAVAQPSIRWSERELLQQMTTAPESEDRNAFSVGYNLLIQHRFNQRSLDSGRLGAALHLLFADQLLRGVWEKRQPLFDFPQKGSAYCFTFELLSSLLFEFQGAHSLLAPFEPHLERALLWVERNANPHHDWTKGDPPAWRSGDRIASTQPESWATAEIFAFLQYFDNHLTRRAQDILRSGFRVEEGRLPSPNAFATLFQPDVPVSGQPSVPVGRLLEQRIFNPLRVGNRFSLVHSPRRERLVRSGILFGPPGTGKTTIVSRIAAYLGWPLVQLDPSDFARDGISRIPAVINDVFDRLIELEDTVILFDELEVLMLSREETEKVGVDPGVFTTSLLPKLQSLHDRAQSLYFLATNRIGKMDEAATREARFDFAIQILPPSLNEKRRMLAELLVEERSLPALEALQDPETADRIEWATRSDMLAVLDALRSSDPSNAGAILQSLQPKLLSRKDALETEARSYTRIPESV